MILQSDEGQLTLENVFDFTDKQNKNEESKQLGEKVVENIENSRTSDEESDEEEPRTPPKRVIEQTKYVEKNHMIGNRNIITAAPNDHAQPREADK